MQKTCFLLLIAALAAPATAGDLWEVSSTSSGPDGSPMTYTDKKCFPKDGINPSQMLDGLGNCTFDKKNGDDAAMTFSMTCKTPGMPPELSAMKVSGDARLNGDKFDMRYTIALEAKQPSAGGDFRMTGSAEARKVGQCNER